MNGYAKPTAIDSPSVGVLYQARNLKRRAWARLKTARAALKHTRLSAGNRPRLRLDVMKAEGAHNEALAMERGALRAIEERANELGKTTAKGGAS